MKKVLFALNDRFNFKVQVLTKMLHSTIVCKNKITIFKIKYVCRKIVFVSLACYDIDICKLDN